MTALFNFGISQDDSRSERSFLKLQHHDRVLCIASGGEVPLDLLTAAPGLHIDAIDFDQNQLYLSQLKFKAALYLDQSDAALLIGYTAGSTSRRLELLDFLKPHMSDAERRFWQAHQGVFNLGAVHGGRFESYIRKYNGLVLALLGKKHLFRLMQFEDLNEQLAYFDRHFRIRLLKFIFKIAFHPKIYKNRGVVEEGLKHSRTSQMAEFFYSRFRDFCVSNLAVENGYYQFTFFNKIIEPRALPDYLQEDGLKQLRDNAEGLHFIKTDIQTHLSGRFNKNYSKYALSNLSDWLTRDEMEMVLLSIHQLSEPGTPVFARYIHAPISSTGRLSGLLNLDEKQAIALQARERYPFYSLVPLRVVKENT